MSGLEKKSWERNRRPEHAIDITKHDDNAKHLIGWPGYRMAQNKSGLGYMETRAEWAHMQGVMIQRMVMGKFKTRNPFYFFCITIYGLFNVSPLFLLFSMEGRAMLMQNLPVFLPPTAIGILLLVNMVLSLLNCEKGESITGD
jgi:hypothetical protein